MIRMTLDDVEKNDGMTLMRQGDMAMGCVIRMTEGEALIWPMCKGETNRAAIAAAIAALVKACRIEFKVSFWQMIMFYASHAFTKGEKQV